MDEEIDVIDYENDEIIMWIDKRDDKWKKPKGKLQLSY